MPRPTWAVWIGDNWRVTDQLTLNYGVRWDVDWGVASPPDVVTNSIPINNNAAAAGTDIPDMLDPTTASRTAFATTATLRRASASPTTSAARTIWSFAAASGLYFTTPVSNMTFSPQIYSQMVTAAFLPPASGRCPDGSNFVTNPACGVTTYEQAQAVAPAQSPRIISPDFKNPYTWQSSIGFQKQINQVTGFEIDLTHFNRVSRHAHHRSQPLLQPGDRLQPEPGRRHGLATGRTGHTRRSRISSAPVTAIRRSCRWR